MAKRGRPPKNGASVETKRRPEIPDKEHLLQYLAANPETEYPFVESVWEQAVERANINKDKQQAYAETTYVDENGNEVKERKKMGVLVTDPVKYYFKLMGLKQNRNKAISIQNQKYEDDENKQSIMEAKFDTSGYDNMEKNMYVDEIGSWIDLFNGDVAKIKISGYTRSSRKKVERSVGVKDFAPHGERYYLKVFTTLERVVG